MEDRLWFEGLLTFTIIVSGLSIISPASPVTVKIKIKIHVPAADNIYACNIFAFIEDVGRRRVDEHARFLQTEAAAAPTP